MDPELGLYSLLDSRMFANAPDAELDDWQRIDFRSTARLNGIAGGNGIVVGVGSDGLVMATPVEAGGYDAWATVQLAGVSVALKAPGADADGDGAANIEEYARGTSPTGPTAQLPISIARSQLGVTAFWTQDPDIDDVTTTIQYSNDLKTWTSSGVLLDVTFDSYSARVTGEPGVSDELYLRVVWSLK